MFSVEDEDVLWSSVSIIQVLYNEQYFFYAGNVFCLCGGEEQRNPKPS